MSTKKSFSTETSERYSRALFEVVKEVNELEKTESDIKNFSSLLKNSLEIKNFIQNPTQSKENQNNVIKLLAEKLNYNVDNELIGGLKHQLGSIMIDTSVKNKLNKYKQKMLES